MIINQVCSVIAIKNVTHGFSWNWLRRGEGSYWNRNLQLISHMSCILVNKATISQALQQTEEIITYPLINPKYDLVEIALIEAIRKHFKVCLLKRK